MKRALLAWLVLAAACSDQGAGGQTGDEGARWDTEPRLTIPEPTRNSSCLELQPAVVLTSLDDARAGVSARDVLDYAQGEFDRPLTWYERGTYDWSPPRTIAPEPTSPSTVEIAIEHGEGEIRYIEGTPAPGLLDQSCGYLEIEVDVRIETASGALAESTKGVLRTYGAGSTWLQLRFHGEGVEIVPPGPTDAPAPPQAVALAGALTVEMPAEAYPEELHDAIERGTIDPETVEPDRDTAYLAMLQVDLRLDADGVHGDVIAWMYAPRLGTLQRTDRLAAIGDGLPGSR